MITLIAATLAVAAPAASAPDAHAQHHSGEHKGCCKEMEAEHGSKGSEHSDHAQ